MTYVHLHHAQRRPSLAAHAPSFDAVRETMASTIAGVTFLLLAAAAGVFSLWLAGGRLLHRLIG